MPPALERAVAVYRVLLCLYPRELRAGYGAEMAEVFEQQLCSAWRERGTRGVLLTCTYALRELFTIAIPAWMMNERVLAPGLSLIITPAVLLSLIAVLQDRALADWINHKFLFAGCCR